MDGRAASPSQVLPTWLTQFFGRQAETAELRGIVERVRCLTLVGAPGCGKTRLGAEVAAGLSSRFADGLVFVELAPIADPQLVAHAIACGVGVREEPGSSFGDTLVESLAGRECLVVLDNCEHLVQEVAPLVGRLLGRCPGLRVLATSRVPLGVAGEQLWRVPPLDAVSAFDLFVDRAGLVSAGFVTDEVSGLLVEEVCARLAGLPLAIELAAAWVRVLSPGEIRDRLDDALPLLRGGAREVGTRHVTMEATVDGSYRLLGPAERVLFERLSVFAGSFDLEAATAIARPDDEDDDSEDGGDALTGLTVLVDHSLVSTEPGHGGPTRYRLLEPVRQCGAVKLADRGDRETVRQRHAEHYRRAAERCDAELRGDGRAEALQRLKLDEGNLLLALDWARTHDRELGLRLCTALAPFWELRGRVDDGRTWLEEMLGHDVTDRQLRASALARAGRLAWRQRDYRHARQLLEESLAIKQELGDAPGVARRLRSLALVAMTEGDPDTAVELCERSIALFRVHGDDQGRLWALIFLALARYVSGDRPGGDRHIGDALTLNRQVGNAAARAYALLYRCYGDNLGGDAAAERQDLVGAISALREAGATVEEPDWLWAGASLALTERRWEAAVRLVAGAEELSRRGGSYMNEQFMGHVESRLCRVRDELGSVATDRLRAEGARMAFAELLTEATTEREPDGDGEAAYPLSPREREVADLIAQGLTNPQIAQRLFISRRTVESHVEHIKQKLGLGTRAEVIAWSLRDTATACP